MKKATLIISTIILLASCVRTVTRVSPDQQIDLSGRWNDTDSKQVADEMIKDLLSRVWINNFNHTNEKKPVVIVGFVANKSTEHIQSESFIKDIEREFINSGLVRVVENSVFREKLREERAQQEEFASIETQAKWGKELGADFMMFGTITSTSDSYKREKVISFKVNLELASIESSEKVWIGNKEIKKYVKN